MFGGKQEKLEKLVKKNQWDKINNHYVNSNDTETRRLLAEACGLSTDDGAFNTLTILVRDADRNVQLAAIASLGKVGKEEHASTELRWLLDKLGDSDAEMSEAIHNALNAMRGRK